MKRNPLKYTAAVALVLLGVYGSQSQEPAKADPVAVVVNAANTVTQLTAAEVREHYLNRQLFDNGDKIWRFYDSSDAPLREAMLTLLKLRNEGELAAHFKTMTYQNHLSGEKGIDGGEKTIGFVGKVNGGLGFVRASVAAGNSTVKVVCTLE